MKHWEKVLRAPAEFQKVVPGAMLVGGLAAAGHLAHRLSLYAAHVPTDRKKRFDEALIRFLPFTMIRFP
jgi:hypothetical protein